MEENGIEELTKWDILQIHEHMNKNTLRIKIKDDINIIGFFCVIPFPDVLNKLNVLITLNNIFQSQKVDKIELIFNNGKIHELLIDKSRKSYFDDKNNIAIIEIKKKDGFSFDSFFEIDYLYINRTKPFYENKSIYTIYFQNNQKAEYSLGKIKNFFNNTFEHSCLGSNGSPIISKDNYEVIGINKQNEKNINYGLIFKEAIKNFFKEEREKLNNNFNEKENKQNILDEITIKYAKKNTFIEEDMYVKEKKFYFFKDFGETISENKIFGEKFVEFNKNICKLIVDNKEYELCSYLKDKNIELNKDIFEIKLKGLNKVSDISYMFCGCLSLLSITGIDKINTDNFKNMSCLFLKCENLESLPDISKWNTINVKNMNGMFYECKSLSKLPDISKWNTTNVKNMSYMFFGCRNLSFLPDISKWNISNVIDINSMFYGCIKLEYMPDISQWNMEKI